MRSARVEFAVKAVMLATAMLLTVASAIRGNLPLLILFAITTLSISGKVFRDFLRQRADGMAKK